MRYIAIIGPRRAVEYFMDDIRGGILNRSRLEVVLKNEICFFYAPLPQSVQGRKLAGYVPIGPRDEWNNDLRATLEYAQYGVRD